MNEENRITGRDVTFIRRLIEWITNHADYGDISELCDELNVDEDWFEQYYEWNEECDG